MTSSRGWETQMRLVAIAVALALVGCSRQAESEPPAATKAAPDVAAATPPPPDQSAAATPDVEPEIEDAPKPKLRPGDVIRFPRGMIACRTKASLTDDVLMAGGGLAGCVSVQPSDKLKVVSVEYERNDPDSALMWVRSPALPFPKAFIVSADDSLWEPAK